MLFLHWGAAEGFIAPSRRQCKKCVFAFVQAMCAMLHLSRMLRCSQPKHCLPAVPA
jgi:hypothetical protein